MAVALAYRQSLIQQVTLTCFGVFILQNLCWARGALLTCLGTFAAMTLATSGGDLICLGMFLFARTAGDGNAVLACFGMFWSLIQVVLCHVLACFSGMFVCKFVWHVWACLQMFLSMCGLLQMGVRHVLVDSCCRELPTTVSISWLRLSGHFEAFFMSDGNGAALRQSCRQHRRKNDASIGCASDRLLQ